MRTRYVTQALFVVAFASAVAPAVAAAASAVRLSGRAGVAYSQYDAWSAGESTRTPRLDIDLGLNARGVVVSRDVLDYAVDAGYRRLSAEVDGVSTDRTNSLSYSARAEILQNPVSPLGLSVFAARGETDFTLARGSDVFGHGIASSAGGTLTLKGLGLPVLIAGYTWNNSETQIPDEERRETTQHTVMSSLSFGNSAFQLTADYNGEFREGSWPTDDYTAHHVGVRALAKMGGNSLTLESRSAFTLPPELVVGTFEQQTTVFSAYLNSPSQEGHHRAFSYSYGHTLVESPLAPASELTRQGVRYEGDHLVTTSTFFTRWLLDASLAETRSGPTLVRSSGETLGVTLWWRPRGEKTKLEMNAGPRIGLIQSEDADSRGYGGTAGIRLSRPIGTHTLQADWRANYASALFAAGGWQFNQMASATVSGALGVSRYTGTFRASAFRTHNPVVGEGAGRMLEALAKITARTVAFDSRASLSSGIVGATPSEFVGDGLLLPAPFNSSTADVSAGATVNLRPGVTAKSRFRLARSDMPGRPVLHEVEAIAAITYRYGGLGLSLEDRVTRYERAGRWDTANRFMATVYRTFGW